MLRRRFLGLPLLGFFGLTVQANDIKEVKKGFNIGRITRTSLRETITYPQAIYTESLELILMFEAATFIYIAAYTNKVKLELIGSAAFNAFSNKVNRFHIDKMSDSFNILENKFKLRSVTLQNFNLDKDSETIQPQPVKKERYEKDQTIYFTTINTSKPIEFEPATISLKDFISQNSIKLNQI